jgi:hypothetical protein
MLAGAALALGVGALPAFAEETVVEEYHKTETQQMKVETVPVKPTPAAVVQERVIVPPPVEKRTTTETVEEED